MSIISIDLTSGNAEIMTRIFPEYFKLNIFCCNFCYNVYDLYLVVHQSCNIFMHIVNKRSKELCEMIIIYVFTWFGRYKCSKYIGGQNFVPCIRLGDKRGTKSWRIDTILCYFWMFKMLIINIIEVGLFLLLLSIICFVIYW